MIPMKLLATGIVLVVVTASLYSSSRMTMTVQMTYKDYNTLSSQTQSDSTAETTTTTTKDRQTMQQDFTGRRDLKDMNIVLFYADDWTWRSVGAVNKHVHTPHMDEMARNGMLFRHNCVTTSICWQSRATLATGLYVAVHQHVKIGSQTMFDETVQWKDTLFPQLKQHGYHVGYVGKWHAPMPKTHREQTFDVFKNYYGSHWMWRNEELRHVTDCNQEDALLYLRSERPKNQKFALTVSFFATHAWDGKRYPDQYQPQPHTAYLYDNFTDIPVPKTATEQHWKDMPYFFNERNEARGRWRERYATPEQYQVSMKRYYRMAKEVDDVIGAVVDELKLQGLYNNTLLIFTTDNGNFHGEHGLAGKWYPHDESVRVPLIIQDPRMPMAMRGTVNDDFTLNIDLAPTILSAANIPVPSHMQGRDMADLYFNPSKANWRNDFFYEWTQGSPVDAVGHNDPNHIPAVFALIRKDYKYFYWPQLKYEQVFHIENDPYEEYDIFNSTAQSEPKMLEELKARYHYLKNRSQAGYPV